MIKYDSEWIKKWNEYIAGLTDLEKPIANTYRDIVEEIDQEERPLKNVLEIGSGWGIFTFAVLHSSEAKVTTIDKIEVGGRPDFNERTKDYQDRIERIVADSMIMVPEMAKEGEKYDLVFVDAGHGYENCISDLEHGWKLLKGGGTLLIDDVFHKKNYEFNDDMEADYGVGRAFWDWARDNLFEGQQLEFYMVGSGGLLRVYKPEE